MEVKIHLEFRQILELIYQLPKNDFEKLLKALQNEYKTKTKKQVKQTTELQELILNAPTWTDVEYNNYLQAKEHLNIFRAS